jgi:exodeoxyribonuclease VII small subunit
MASSESSAGLAAPGGSTAELSYEQARAELARVVERLESGCDTLEESLSLWERGEGLATVCQRWLDAARARLDTARAARDR